MNEFARKVEGTGGNRYKFLYISFIESKLTEEIVENEVQCLFENLLNFEFPFYKKPIFVKKKHLMVIVTKFHDLVDFWAT